MEKSKSKFLKVSFIGLFVTLCLFIFPFFMAQKSNAFYFDYDGLGPFDFAISDTSGYSYYNFNMLNSSIIDYNVLNQLYQEFPTLYDDYYDCNYNTYYFALFDNSTGNAFVECYDYGILTRYVELYIEYVGTPFDSSNSLYNHLDMVGFVPMFNNSSNYTYLRSFVDSLYSHYFQSSGYTEQEYQDYGNQKYNEGIAAGKVQGVTEFKNSTEYSYALNNAEIQGENYVMSLFMSVFDDYYPDYPYEPHSSVLDELTDNIRSLVDMESEKAVNNAWYNAQSQLNQALEQNAVDYNIDFTWDNLGYYEPYDVEKFRDLADVNIFRFVNLSNQNSFESGVTDGLTSSDTLMKIFKQIFSAPSYILGGIFDFEFLGVNIYTLISFILTAMVLGFILKKILGL